MKAKLNQDGREAAGGEEAPALLKQVRLCDAEPLVTLLTSQ